MYKCNQEKLSKIKGESETTGLAFITIFIDHIDFTGFMFYVENYKKNLTNTNTNIITEI